MFSNFQERKTWILTAGAALLLLALIGFAEARQSRKRCQSVVVRIDELDGRRFLTRRDVTGYLTNQGTDPVVGEPFTALNFSALERRLRQHGLVQNCNVARDLAGNLVVTVEQPRPLARLLTTLPDNRPLGGQYVSEQGRFFAISMNYSARVPLLSGDYFDRRRSLKGDSALLALLRYVQADPFWRAQIAELNVDAAGNVVMWPQVGQQQIEFGKPENIDVKFKKLKLFYTHVMPYKGWDRYHRVNVQYRNQIVCE